MIPPTEADEAAARAIITQDGLNFYAVGAGGNDPKPHIQEDIQTIAQAIANGREATRDTEGTISFGHGRYRLIASGLIDEIQLWNDDGALEAISGPTADIVRALMVRDLARDKAAAGTSGAPPEHHRGTEPAALDALEASLLDHSGHPPDYAVIDGVEYVPPPLSPEARSSLAAGIADVKAGRVSPLDMDTLEPAPPMDGHPVTHTGTIPTPEQLEKLADYLESTLEPDCDRCEHNHHGIGATALPDKHCHHPALPLPCRFPTPCDQAPMWCPLRNTAAPDPPTVAHDQSGNGNDATQAIPKHRPAPVYDPSLCLHCDYNEDAATCTCADPPKDGTA